MSIISRFDDLEKCAGTAERSGTFKADRNRLFGKCRPVQQLCTARQANFPLVPVDFGNAELGQLLPIGRGEFNTLSEFSSTAPERRARVWRCIARLRQAAGKSRRTLGPFPRQSRRRRSNLRPLCPCAEV